MSTSDPHTLVNTLNTYSRMSRQQINNTAPSNRKRSSGTAEEGVGGACLSLLVSCKTSSTQAATPCEE